MRKLLLVGITIGLASAAFADRTMYVMMRGTNTSRQPVNIPFKATCTEQVFVKMKALDAQAATGGAGAGKIRFNEFTIKKTTDASTPLIHKALVNNERFANLVLRFYNHQPSGKEEVYFTITLTNARISKLTKEPPTRESITFVFGKD